MPLQSSQGFRCWVLPQLTRKFYTVNVASTLQHFFDSPFQYGWSYLSGGGLQQRSGEDWKKLFPLRGDAAAAAGEDDE